jgi:hypothetical protein
MKRKTRRSKSKSGKSRGGFILLFIAGMIVLSALLFHREISNLVKPWLQDKGVLREKKRVILYFSDGEGEYLVGERREISRRDVVEDEAEEVISELTRGPKGKLTPTLPRKAKLLNIQLDERGIARVNFSRELTKDHPGGSSAEMMTVYSIVNSLALNFPEIKQVQILVEGKGMETIAGHIASGQPIGSNPGLIKKKGGGKGQKKPGAG